MKVRPFRVEVNYVDIYGNAQAVTLPRVLACDIAGAIQAAGRHFLAVHKARVMDARPAATPPPEQREGVPSSSLTPTEGKNEMIALSIRQPWAWLIIRPDITDPATRLACLGRDLKDFENRDWPTKFRGRFLIHAGKGMTRDEYEDAKDTAMTAVRGVIPSFPAFEELQRGGIVGEAEIIDCVNTNEMDLRGEKYPSPWLFGIFGFKLANARPLPFTPCRGQLGFFQAPAPPSNPLPTRNTGGT